MSEPNPYRRRFRRVIHPRNPETDICKCCRFFERTPYVLDLSAKQIHSMMHRATEEESIRLYLDGIYKGECRRDQHYEKRKPTDWCGQFSPVPSTKPTPEPTALDDLDTDEETGTQTKKVQ